MTSLHILLIALNNFTSHGKNIYYTQYIIKWQVIKFEKVFICLVLSSSIAMCSCSNASRKNTSSVNTNNTQSKYNNTQSEVKNDNSPNLLINSSAKNPQNTQSKSNENQNTEKSKKQPSPLKNSSETKSKVGFMK